MRHISLLCIAFVCVLSVLAVSCKGSDSNKYYFLPHKFKYHLGDDLKWKDPSYDDSKWEEIEVPHSIPLSIKVEPTYFWYRVKFFLKNENLPRDIGLFLGTIGDIDETYINGFLIGKTGQFYPKGSLALHIPRIYRVPSSFLNLNGENTLSIRCQKATVLQAGIYRGKPVLGEYAPLFKKASKNYFLSTQLALFFAFFTIIIGLYHLYLYFRLPSQKANLWYFIFTVVSSVFIASLSLKVSEWISSIKVIIKLHAVSGIFSTIFFLHCVHHVFRRKYDKVSKVLLAANIAFLPFVLFAPDWLSTYKIFQTWYPVCLATIVYLLFRSFSIARHGRNDLMGLAVAMIIMLITAMLDISYGLGLIDIIQVSSLGFFALNLGFMFSLAHDFTAAYSNIEEQVAQRTEALKRANESLKELDKAKSRFFANISHELRTPLTVALSVVDSLAAEQQLPSKTTQELAAAKQNLQKLLGLINDLLDLTKTDAGAVSLFLKKFDINLFIKEIIVSHTPLAGRKGIDLTLHTTSQEPCSVIMDPDKIEKIIVNLISNAIKFTDTGGKIKISLNCKEDKILISVADTGRGIPPDKLDKIFDRFAQAHEGGTGGTGIGLSLVKEYTELHGGTVDVESTPGKGTTFNIVLPKSQPKVNPQDVPQLQQHKTETPEMDMPSVCTDTFDTTPKSDPFKPTVLVVEDNKDLRSLLRSMLENSYNVYEASDGEEGIKKAEEVKPDLIITDLMMPNKDGLQLTSEIRKNKELAATPIILLTARADIEDKLAGFREGTSDYIVKPFDKRELLARVDSFIKMKTLQDRLVQADKLASLGILTAGICHELRNPLNNIGAASLMLGPDTAPDEIEKAADTINNAVERADKIIRDLLKFARSESEPASEQNLYSLVKETMSYIGSSNRNRIKLQNTDENIVVPCRPSQIQQVVLNLTMNALQASKEEEQVNIKVSRDEHFGIIEIEDKGVGMSKEVVKRIFDPFFTTKDPGKGTGLGLSIVHKIITAHGGNIDVFSEEGVGTKVTVRLPLEHNNRENRQNG